MIIRLRYNKLGKIRFIGHRDVARVFERAMRGAQVPVAYSEGFSPRPKLAFGLALSVGYESDNEYLDVVLSQDTDLEQLLAGITKTLPEGIGLLEVGEVQRGQTSLMEAVTSCDWHIDYRCADARGVQEIADSVERLIAADTVTITRERKGKTVEDDIRPDVLSAKVFMKPEQATGRIVTELSTERRSLRPAELLSALDSNVDVAKLRRVHQWISHGEARIEPHEAVVSRAAHSVGSAS